MLATTLREKACQHCGTSFRPWSSTQTVCSPTCARRKGEADKKAEKAKDKAQREKLKTIPDLIREAQVEFNKWVRTRDEKQPCISCGKPPPDLSELHAGRDAGHYRSTGAASHLRFHEDNCHAQCVNCNQYKAGNAVDYRIRLVERIGIARVETLEADNEPVKWDRDTLKAIKVIYRAKTRQLKKDQP